VNHRNRRYTDEPKRLTGSGQHGTWSGQKFMHSLTQTTYHRRTGGARTIRGHMRNVETPFSSLMWGPYSAKMCLWESGHRMTEEANASGRKATGIHNRLDPSQTNPKGC
jgi:hypothetical protein